MRIRIRRKPNRKSSPERIERAYRAMLFEQEMEKKRDLWLNRQTAPYEL